MKVLVTGGGGFLGRAIVRQLLDRGDTVTTINRSDYPELAELGVTCHRGDIADREAVMVAAEGADAVIHVAAKAGPDCGPPISWRPMWWGPATSSMPVVVAVSACWCTPPHPAWCMLESTSKEATNRCLTPTIMPRRIRQPRPKPKCWCLVPAMTA